MALEKRGNIWWYDFQYKGQRYRGSSGFTNKRDAQEVELNLKQQVRKQTHLGVTPDMTWGEAMTKYWQSEVVPKGRPKTAKNHLFRYEKIREEIGPDRLLREITTRFLSQYKDDLLSGKIRGKPLKPGTVKRRFADISAILNKAYKEWETLERMPKMPEIKVGKGRVRYLREEEEQRLLAVSPPHLQNFIIFCVDTGARKGEAASLKWRDVDMREDGVWRVRFEETKSDKPRSVPLPDRARALLEKLYQERPADVDEVLTWNGKPAGDPKKAFNKAVEAAGLYQKGPNNVTPHTLRHTFASRLVMAGIPLLEVRELLGHASIKTTEIYAHLAPAKLDSAISVLNRRQA